MGEGGRPGVGENVLRPTIQVLLGGARISRVHLEEGRRKGGDHWPLFSGSKRVLNNVGPSQVLAACLQCNLFFSILKTGPGNTWVGGMGLWDGRRDVMFLWGVEGGVDCLHLCQSGKFH